MEVTNALTFDVEDWFQVNNLKHLFKFEEWHKCESRIGRNVEKILDLLSRYRVKATFFILGWVAENHTHIVRIIEREGHEIGIHGYCHRLIYEMTRNEFKKDITKTLQIIKGLTNTRVIGHRAPSFSITKKTTWAMEVLKENHIEYDSSIFPIFHPDYGIPDAPRTPYNAGGVIEFPLSTITILGKNFPISGGGYFRLLPYRVTKLAITKLNKGKVPVIFYLHPWELDPGQPIQKLSPFKRLRHYINLEKTQGRLERLLCDFRFTTAREVLESTLLLSEGSIIEG